MTVMSEMAVVCDDLTGAMEAGLMLYNKGFRVYVTMDRNFMRQQKAQADAYVINTESRNVSADKAVKNIGEAWETICQAGLELIYKKVDSTLRGNLGKELEAILAAAPIDMIILAPALPFNGRTTRDGNHYLNGSKLEESDLAQDPFSPICDSYIPNLIMQQTYLSVCIVPLEDIRQGELFLVGRLAELHSEGCRIAVLDAETEDDLEVISTTMVKSSLKLLPCGSAGLFARMKIQMEKNIKAQSLLNYCKRDYKRKPVLILSGSPAKVTKDQIRLAGAYNIRILKPHLDRRLEGTKDMTNEMEQLAQKALELLNAGNNVIIDGAGEGKGEIAALYQGDNRLLLSDSVKIQEFLSQVFKEVVSKTDISGAMIIGGDTLHAVCSTLEIKALKITGEVEPFIPAGIMLRERGDEIPVVSKAGGFGGEDVIVKTVRFFEGKIE